MRHLSHLRYPHLGISLSVPLSSRGARRSITLHASFLPRARISITIQLASSSHRGGTSLYLVSSCLIVASLSHLEVSHSTITFLGILKHLIFIWTHHVSPSLSDHLSGTSLHPRDMSSSLAYLISWHHLSSGHLLSNWHVSSLASTIIQGCLNWASTIIQGCLFSG